MASSAKHFVLFFLLAFLSSSKLTQARQSQFFSKVATTTTTVAPTVVKDASENGIEDQPNFIQDSQTGYGLYDHGTGQLPPDSDTTKSTLNSSPYTTARDVQPNEENNERMSGTSLMNQQDQGYSTNYNVDKTYETKPEGYTDSNNYNNNEYVTKPEEYYGASNNNNNNNYYYNNNNEYGNEQQQGFSGTSLMDRRSPTAYNQEYTTKPDGYDSTNNNYNNGGVNTYNEEYATKPDGYDSTNNNYNNGGVNTHNSQNQQQQGFGEVKYLGEFNNNKNTNYYQRVNNNINNNGGVNTYNEEYATKPDGYDSTNNNYNYNYNNGGVNTYNSQNQQQQGFGEVKYLGEFNNNKNTNYYKKVNNNDNAAYNGQRQGMSDTRFMENGKYYYDVKNEYNYNPNNGLDQYSNNGYSGSNNINGNSMEGYQNQESELDGFNP